MPIAPLVDQIMKRMKPLIDKEFAQREAEEHSAENPLSFAVYEKALTGSVPLSDDDRMRVVFAINNAIQAAGYMPMSPQPWEDLARMQCAAGGSPPQPMLCIVTSDITHLRDDWNTITELAKKAAKLSDNKYEGPGAGGGRQGR
jgi:hypothetical protein